MRQQTRGLLALAAIAAGLVLVDRRRAIRLVAAAPGAAPGSAYPGFPLAPPGRPPCGCGHG